MNDISIEVNNYFQKKLEDNINKSQLFIVIHLIIVLILLILILIFFFLILI